MLPRALSASCGDDCSSSDLPARVSAQPDPDRCDRSELPQARTRDDRGAGGHRERAARGVRTRHRCLHRSDRRAPSESGDVSGDRTKPAVRRIPAQALSRAPLPPGFCRVPAEPCRVGSEAPRRDLGPAFREPAQAGARRGATGSRNRAPPGSAVSHVSVRTRVPDAAGAPLPLAHGRTIPEPIANASSCSATCRRRGSSAGAAKHDQARKRSVAVPASSTRRALPSRRTRAAPRRKVNMPRRKTASSI